MNDQLLRKVTKFILINNAVHFNKSDGNIDPESPQPWVRTSLLFEYLSESKQSLHYPFVDVNGENVTEVDFHVDASFDYIQEIGIWDDGEEIDENWWFRNLENNTEALFQVPRVFDQVKILGKQCLKLLFFSHLSKIN